MRILLFSDLQLDRPYKWAPPGVGNKRREAAKESFATLLAEARERSVDLIACAGDLFDRECIQPSNLRWLMTAFESVSLPVLIAPGDQDWLGPRSGYTQYTWPQNVTVFHTERLSPVIVSKGVTIWGAAHRGGDAQQPFLERFKVDRDGINIGLFHAAESGALSREPSLKPTTSFEDGDVERVGLDHVLTGHSQKLYLGPAHTYSGAPIAHDFEAGPAGGFVILDVRSKKSLKREFVPLPTLELTEASLDLSDLRSRADLNRRLKSAGAELRDIARLRLKGTLPYHFHLEANDLRKGVGKLEQLLLETSELLLSGDVESLTSEPSVRGQFVRDVINTTRLPDIRRDRILSLGLRALEGKEELQVLT